MDPLSSPRKRKRPSYLDDFFETLVEEDAPMSKKKTTQSTAQASKKEEPSSDCCLLCGAVSENPDEKWDLSSTTGSSKFTFSDVLNKMFKEAQLPPSVQKQDFSSGYLCQNCKDFVSELDQLQNQVIGVKQSILHSFKKSKRTEKKNPETAVSEPPTKTENPEKILKKKTKKAPKEDVYIIESLKEKKGNNFLVKWENYTDEENTWEPRSSIPGFILKFYDMDLKRLGQPAPPLPLVEEEESDEIESVEEIAPKPKLKEKTKKKEDLEEKAMEKLWRGEAAPKSPKKKPASLEPETEKTEKKDDVEKPTEEVYNIEALIEKKGSKYLVQWENFKVDQNTWEPRTSIPGFILKFYEKDLTRLGMPAPANAEEAEVASEKLNVSDVSESLDSETPMEETEVPKEVEKDEPILKRKTSPKESEKSKKKEEVKQPEIPQKKEEEKQPEIESEISEKEDVTKQTKTSKKNAIPKKKEEEQLTETTTKPKRRRSEAVPPTPITMENKTTKVETKKPEVPKKEKKTKQKPIPEDVYNIEALVEKKGSKFLVKWENWPSDTNTWEPKASIPAFILKWYEQDMSRLGKAAPNPEQAKQAMLEKEKTELKPKVAEKPKEAEKPIEAEKPKEVEKPKDQAAPTDTEKPKSDRKTATSEKKTEPVKIPTEPVKKTAEPVKKSVEPIKTKKKEETKPPKPEKLIKEIKEPIASKPETSKKKDVKATKKSKAVVEDVYIIESLVKKKGNKFLVKWENWPSDTNTWEPKASIPKFILKFYEEDPKRLGTPAPSGSQAAAVEEEEEEEDFEVEQIMDRRTIKKGKVEYLVMWKNFDDPSDYTWEFGSNLNGVQDMIDNYEKEALY